MSTRTHAKTIYEILEEVRKDKGLSQRQACAELKTTTTTWRNWGRGQTPGWDWEKKFIEFTGLSRDEIVDAIAEHARRHPDFVHSLSRVPLSGRSADYRRPPGWDGRPNDEPPPLHEAA